MDPSAGFRRQAARIFGREQVEAEAEGLIDPLISVCFSSPALRFGA
jgi:hypothetical protein